MQGRSRSTSETPASCSALSGHARVPDATCCAAQWVSLVALASTTMRIQPPFFSTKKSRPTT